jgi:hypothetical protein
MNDCIICTNNQEYYANFKCNPSHIICLNCIENGKINKCYFKCNCIIDFTNLYINKKI